MNCKVIYNAWAASMVMCGVLGLPQDAIAQSVAIVSELGAKCMDAERGTAQGARLIGFSCNPGASNQLFQFNNDATITQGGLCLNISGGKGRSGDQLVLWPCHGGANQKWTMQSDGSIKSSMPGIGSKCLDLQYGDNPVYWVVNAVANQAVILWDCHGGKNQRWAKGVVVPKSRVSNFSSLLAAGSPGNLRYGNMTAQQMAKLIGVDGGTLIGVDGGTLIAAGGQNMLYIAR